MNPMTRPLLTYLTRGSSLKLFHYLSASAASPGQRAEIEQTLYNQPAHASDKLRGLKWESKEWNWDEVIRSVSGQEHFLFGHALNYPDL